jgi:hypothetical protein
MVTVVALKNTGRSPAFNVSPSFKILNSVGKNDNPVKEQKKFAMEQRARPLPKGADGFTIFPGEEPIQHSMGTTLSREEIEKGNLGSETASGTQRTVIWPIIAPVLPHVILLPDASRAMLPAGLGLGRFEGPL